MFHFIFFSWIWFECFPPVLYRYTKEANSVVVVTGAETLMQELLGAAPCSSGSAAAPYLKILEHRKCNEDMDGVHSSLSYLHTQGFFASFWDTQYSIYYVSEHIMAACSGLLKVSFSPVFTQSRNAPSTWLGTTASEQWETRDSLVKRLIILSQNKLKLNQGWMIWKIMRRISLEWKWNKLCSAFFGSILYVNEKW